MIRHIICAVRGGLASQATADRAIDLASEAGAKLTFLHVVDPGCLDCGDVAMTSAAYREFVVLEYEKSADPCVAWPRFIAQLREAFG